MNHKYTGLALFAALVAIGAPPACAESAVVSQNTVGYSKLTMRPDGYTLIANPFVEVGTGLDIAIKDMFAEDTTEATPGTSAANADSLEVWDGTGYTTYFFRNAATPYWIKSGDRKETLDPLPPGEGAFYHRISNSEITLTISGEVKKDNVTLSIIPGYNLLKNPFPTSLSFDTFLVEGATAGSSAANADTIEVWDGSGYVVYFLRNATPAPYWMKSGDRKPTTDTLDPYTGFFYHAIGNTPFDVVVASPIAESNDGN